MEQTASLPYLKHLKYVKHVHMCFSILFGHRKFVVGEPKVIVPSD